MPGHDVLELGIDRLPHAGEEIDEGEEQDIRERQPIAADERLAIHETVEPFEFFLRGLLQVVRGLRNAMDAVLEHLEPFGVAEAVRHRLQDAEIDASCRSMNFWDRARRDIRRSP